MATRIFHHLPGKEFITLKKFLAMKFSRPARGRTRNTLRAKNEGKIRLPAGEQADHSISANALQGPGSWLRVLECLATHIFINPLHGIVARDECFSPALSAASAVFFSVPAARSSDESRCHSAPESKPPTAPGRSRDSPFSPPARTLEPRLSVLPTPSAL